jgi:TatD DNase family protein
MELIDTHCHLYWDSFREDLPDVLARARAAGVTQTLIPATDLGTLQQALDIAAAFAHVYVAAGIHPHDAGAAPADAWESLATLARSPHVVAIGEIGLDYHYDFTPRPQQHAALHAQLALARRLSLPVIIHNRESDEDVLAIVREHQDGALRGQFHCFGFGPDIALRVLDLGFHISFTGNVTYKKTALDDVVRAVPLDRLLLETDAPFMAPVPHRGTRNEPAHLPLTLARIADILGRDAAEVAARTTANARALFGLPHPQRTDSGDRPA